MSSNSALETDGLGKRYGSKWALRDCSLEISAGSVTALVGPNGAGKTTLLQLAVGLHDEPGRTFRVPPRWYADISANLTIANMDFAEFADAVDKSGTYRGFEGD